MDLASPVVHPSRRVSQSGVHVQERTTTDLGRSTLRSPEKSFVGLPNALVSTRHANVPQPVAIVALSSPARSSPPPIPIHDAPAGPAFFPSPRGPVSSADAISVKALPHAPTPALPMAAPLPELARPEAPSRALPVAPPPTAPPEADTADRTSCWGNLRHKSPFMWTLRILLLVIYLVILVGAALVVVELVATHAERHLIAWWLAAIAVAVAVPLSLHDVAMHFEHYRRPRMQYYYLVIVIFVPVFATQSWLALRYHEHRIYFVLVREIYEGFVLYCFFKCMVEFFGSHRDILGGPEALYARLSSHAGVKSAKPVFPLCFMPHWRLDERFVRRCTFGVGQFFAIRVAFAAINLVLDLAWPEYFQEGEWKNPTAGYLYFVLIVNFSQLWAMYCLVMFYHVVADQILPINPLRKFLAIKAIVFLTFWQGVLFEGLAYVDVIQASVEFTQQDVKTGIEDFLICIECVAFAIAHHYYFSYKDFEPGSKAVQAMDAMELPPVPVAALGEARISVVESRRVSPMPSSSSVPGSAAPPSREGGPGSAVPQSSSLHGSASQPAVDEVTQLPDSVTVTELHRASSAVSVADTDRQPPPASLVALEEAEPPEQPPAPLRLQSKSVTEGGVVRGGGGTPSAALGTGGGSRAAAGGSVTYAGGRSHVRRSIVAGPGAAAGGGALGEGGGVRAV